MQLFCLSHQAQSETVLVTTDGLLRSKNSGSIWLNSCRFLENAFFYMSLAHHHLQGYFCFLFLVLGFFGQSAVYACGAVWPFITFKGLKHFSDATVSKKWKTFYPTIEILFKWWQLIVDILDWHPCLSIKYLCQLNYKSKGHILTLHTPSFCLPSLSFSLQMFPVFTRLWWRWSKGGVLAFSACDRATVRTVCKPFECCLNSPQPPIHPTHAREPNNTSKLPPIAPALTPTSPFS